MEMEQLIDDLRDDLLDFVTEKVEELGQLPIMLEDIGYLDDKEEVISQVTFCEVLVPDEFEIQDFKLSGDDAELMFTYSYILSAWSDETQLLRVTATMEGTCLIPDVKEAKEIDFEEVEPIQEYMSKVRLIDWKYSGVECDDIRVMDFD